MRFFTKSLLLLPCLAVLCMQGCTSKSESEPISSPGYHSVEDSLRNLPADAIELGYCGWLLSSFYVNAETELGEFDDYYQQGVKNGYPAEYYEFPDVEYMFGSLSDNYTNYYGPRYAAQLMNWLLYSEESIGIGADIKEVTVPNCEADPECGATKTVLVFNHVYPLGPADKAGIQKGDTLVSIDQVEVHTKAIFEKIATGEDGDTTAIVVKRGEETLSSTVTYGEYLTPTVFLDEEDSIPVITITEFTDTTYMSSGTYGEFMQALKDTEGAKATIIDLRGNPGGSVPQCMDMTSELIGKNDTMALMISHDLDTVRTKGVLDTVGVVDTLVWQAEEDGIAKGRYFVFLADTGSASCAELMLVGTVSNTKSPIVGLTTYGKGIGQTYVETYAGGIAGITSMRMLDKNMKIYHRFGIEPDYVEGDPDKAMAIAVQLAKERTAVRTKEYGSVDTGHFTLAKSHAPAGKNPERGGAYKVVRDLKYKKNPAPEK